MRIVPPCVFLLLCLISVIYGFAVEVSDAVYSTLTTRRTTPVILKFRGPSVRQVLEDHEKKLKLQGGYGNACVNGMCISPTGTEDVADILKQNSQKQQAETLRLLNHRHNNGPSATKFTQLWIANRMVIHNMDKDLLQILKRSKEIARIEPNAEFQLTNSRLQPTNSILRHSIPHSLDMPTRHHSAAWNIRAVGAPNLWQAGVDGSGITVGIIDTGIHATHRIVSSRWRTSYSWFDAIQGQLKPYDDNGHGTHCAGIIAGSEGFGVAPNSSLIACKGIKSDGRGTISNLLHCGQFMLCPTDASGQMSKCSARPKVINNSWTVPNGQNLDFYNDVIDAWLAANMIVIFGNGNNGPRCNTTGYPASSDMVVAVGAVDRQNRIAAISSRGPAADRFKPDIVAPGKDVLSAAHYNNNAFMPLTGTSMAAPHVAGAAALLSSANMSLTQSDFREFIIRNTKTVANIDFTCGSAVSSSHVSYPNNEAGFGSLSLKTAVT